MDIPTTAGPNLGNNTTAETGPEVVYAGREGLLAFHDAYKNYHGYIAAIVCIFGIIANILNIVVLTRKNMISATNCILTGLAVSDGLTMVAYLPFALRFYCLYGTEVTPERNTLGAIRFLLFYACFSVVVHTVSIWLTVTLAVFRYIFIRHPRHGAVMCSLPRAKIAVFLTYIVTLIVCIPNFVTITVKGQLNQETAHNNTSTHQYTWVVEFKDDTETDLFVFNFNFWVQAMVVKLVPCVGLTILSVLLVRTMKKAEQRRQNLLMKNMKPGVREDGNSTQGITERTTTTSSSSRDRKTNRTTRMLLVVVALFLVTEFPQGILSLLSGILPDFYEQVYGPLGELMDILALINNGINFILYCAMSKQFRDTFIEIFLAPFDRDKRRFSLVPTTSTNLKSEI